MEGSSICNQYNEWHEYISSFAKELQVVLFVFLHCRRFSNSHRSGWMHSTNCKAVSAVFAK